MRALIASIGLILTVGCASTSSSSQNSSGGSLYERLGGKEAIAQVVEDFVGHVAADDRVSGRWANSDMARFKQHLIDQICQASGGPCQYAGKDMRTAHAKMGITDAEFGVVADHLKTSLDRFHVGEQEQKELLGAIGGMKKEIVQEGPASMDGYAQEPGEPFPYARAPLRTRVNGSRAPAAPMATADPKAARPPGPPAGAPDPISEQAQMVREAADLLEKAGAARQRGNRSFADQLFSTAELLLGPQALAQVAPLFREGAPPRVTTPLKQMSLQTPPQPPAVGNSEAEEPDAKPSRGSLSGTVRFEGGGPAEDMAVVTLEPASGKFRRPSPRQRVVEQRHREFAPKLLVVPVGSTVSFPNFDGVFHNVFSLSETMPFDLGYYKSGQSREIVFEKEGIIRIGCNLHANMTGHIVVVSAPYYAVTDAKGHFSFRSLPPGKYVVRAFSERTAEPLKRSFEVKPDKNTIGLTLVANAPAAPLTDKFGQPRDAKGR